MDTIIFDIGNVLVRFDWDGYMKKLFGADEKTIQAVETAVWQDMRWVEFDRGVMPEAEVIDLILAHAKGYEDAIRIVVDRIGEVIERKDTAIPWIRELKEEGHKVLFLSNYSDLLRRANPGALDFVSLMDGGVWSDEAKLLKPDPKIYLLVCEQNGVSPKDCIFIDDTEENVRGAEAVGMRAIRYSTYEETYRRLKEMKD